MHEPWVDELLADHPRARSDFREHLRAQLLDAWRETECVSVDAEPERPRRRSWPLAVAAGATALLLAGLVVVADTDDASDPLQSRTTAQTPSPVEAVPGSRPGAWRRMSKAPIAARVGAAAVVTSDEFVIWGGWDRRALADGAAYSFDDGTWRTMAPAPLSPRSDAVAVWTGEEVLIWGGDSGRLDDDGDLVYDGAAWNPRTDTWREIPSFGGGALAGRTGVAWTGNELVLVDIPAVHDAELASNTVAIDATTGDWRAMDPIPTPQRRTTEDGKPYEPRGRTAVFTGEDVLVVSVADGFDVTIDRLDPASGTWKPTVTTSLPGLNVGTEGVEWTGTELIIVNHLGSGAVFNPADNSLRDIDSSSSNVRFPAIALGNDIISVGDQLLDVRSGTWRDAAPVPNPHGEFPEVGGHDHSLYVWGGDACGPAADCTGLVDPGPGLIWTPLDETATAEETTPSSPITGTSRQAKTGIPVLESTFACGDLFAYAVSADGSTALSVHFDHANKGAPNYNRQIELPDPRVTVELLQGVLRDGWMNSASGWLRPSRPREGTPRTNNLHRSPDPRSQGAHVLRYWFSEHIRWLNPA